MYSKHMVLILVYYQMLHCHFGQLSPGPLGPVTALKEA